MWEVDYEQCPATETWVYKFDHVPIEGEGWHKLNNGSQAVYRLSGGYLQCLNPRTDVPNETWQFLLAVLQEGALETADALEVIIAQRPDGYQMWSHWCGPKQVARFQQLSREGLCDAYQRLLEIEGND